MECGKENAVHKKAVKKYIHASLLYMRCVVLKKILL